MDPYKVLGISSDATDAEVKKAYRALAKKYHPDNYVNNPLADLAAEKMKQINEAYDEIQKQRAAGLSSGSSAGGAGGASYGGSGAKSGEYIRVRELINAGRFSEAEVLLGRKAASERTAEWHFLYGHIMLHKGWMMEARQEFETACRMDPYNSEYQNTLVRMGQGASGDPYARSTHTSGCSGCDLCMGLLCADCLCDCVSPCH